MGAISEAATGYVISGRPELTPELADRLIDTIMDGWTTDEQSLMTLDSFLRGSRVIVLLLVTLTSLARASVASAQQLSRAQAVAQALAANPEVKLSLEQVALLEGRIREARADALPDVTWIDARRSLARSRAVEQPELRSVSAGVPHGASPDSDEPVRHVRRTSSRRCSASSLARRIQAARLARSAGQEEVRRARQATALQAVQAYNQLLFAIEQLRVARSTIDQKQSHLDVGAQPPRGRCGHRARSAARRGRSREPARRAAARGDTVTAARARLNTVMLRPTDTPIEPTDVLAAAPVATTFEQARRRSAGGEAGASGAAAARSRSATS